MRNAPTLAARSRQSEMMDDPALDYREHVRALAGLARIHALSGTLKRLWKPIQRLIRTQRLRELTVMDVGCGDGLLLRQLSKLARHDGCELRLIGCDFSPRAVDLCRDAAKVENLSVDVYQLDVTQHSLPSGADVIINSLFLHHLAEQDVCRVLSQFADKAQRLVVIEDLLRSRFGLALCWLGVHLLSRSNVVHIDGPLSIRAAFTMPEIRALVDQAGLAAARIRKSWPERYTIEWTPLEQAPYAGR